MQREVTAICHHYKEEDDTARHTLEYRPACSEPRRVLQLVIGESVAPVVKAMLRGRQGYPAVRTFYEQVMLTKERGEERKEKSPRSS
jgi:hypothetical protein